ALRPWTKRSPSSFSRRCKWFAKSLHIASGGGNNTLCQAAAHASRGKRIHCGRSAMAKKKRMPKDEANEILMQRGFFSGLMKIFNEVEVSKEEGAKIKAGLFKFILKKVVEAK